MAKRTTRKKMVDTARVNLWGRNIGAVTWWHTHNYGVFQYNPDFLHSGIQIAPFKMPLRPEPYVFPNLRSATFMGLPGLLSDSLPDKFGNTLINSWLAMQDREQSSFTPVERLCYIGTRATGALEFQPSWQEETTGNEHIQIEALQSLADKVLDQRISLHEKFSDADDDRAIHNILRVGTSAGGARAKALLAYNERSGEFRSGHIAQQDAGFRHWLFKFDGEADQGGLLGRSLGHGRIEYAYNQMTLAAGIIMQECQLLERNQRAHFMTRRFDRSDNGDKLHMQSLCAMMHYDFNLPDAWSYEQAVTVIRKLNADMKDIEQLFKRAVFNVITRNQDDHTKNITFLMDKAGQWRLSPAYDVTYAYNPYGDWTSQHQMSINNKRDHFTMDDIQAFARYCGIKPRKAANHMAEVAAATARWHECAEQAGMPEETADIIASVFRNELC